MGQSSTGTLADKINRLFEVVRRPDREQYRNEEVAATATTTGTTRSAGTSTATGPSSAMGAIAMAELPKMTRLKTGKEISRMSVTRIVATVGMAVAIVAATAIPAQASEPIKPFEVTTTSTQAGGHPDLQTNFELEDPGEPEAAENVARQASPGRLRQPQRGHQMHLRRLRPRSSARPTPRSGWSPSTPTTPATTTTCSARRPSSTWTSRSADETARFAFIVPVAQHPDQHPGRGADRRATTA